jgi:hypothetical protein
MPLLLYTCPTVGKSVEVWYETGEDPAEVADALLETVVCSACGQVHLVEPRTGRVVGNDGEKAGSVRGPV